MTKLIIEYQLPIYRMSDTEAFKICEDQTVIKVVYSGKETKTTLGDINQAFMNTFDISEEMFLMCHKLAKCEINQTKN